MNPAPRTSVSPGLVTLWSLIALTVLIAASLTATAQEVDEPPTEEGGEIEGGEVGEDEGETGETVEEVDVRETFKTLPYANEYEWEELSHGFRRPNLLTIAVDPRDSFKAFAGVNSIVYRTTNGGRNWEAVHVVTAREGRFTDDESEEGERENTKRDVVSESDWQELVEERYEELWEET